MPRMNFGIRDRLNFQAENSPRIFPINPSVPGELIHSITAYGRGQVIVSGGTVNGTSRGENPGGLWAQNFAIDAVSKGRYRGGRIKFITPRTVNRRRIFDRGFLEPDLVLGAAGLSGAAGTFIFDSMFELPFAQPHYRHPVESSLPRDEYNALTLTINNGSRNNQFAGNDRTFDVSGMFWELVDYRQVPANDFKPLVVLFDTDLLIIINAANQRLTIDADLPKSEGYLDFLLIAENTANLVLADTIVNRVTLFDGEEQFYDQFEDQIKGEQRRRVTDFAQSMTGLYYSEFVRDEGQGVLGADAVGNLRAIVDVSNPGGAGLDDLLVSTRRVAAAAL